MAEICSYLLAAESIIPLMLPGYGGANRCQKSRESYFAKIIQKPNKNLFFYRIHKLYLSNTNHSWQKMHFMFTQNVTFSFSIKKNKSCYDKGKTLD